MKIAKPILLVSTPVGVVGGLIEAYRMAGGLVVIMATMVILITAAMGGLIGTARREEREERERRAQRAQHHMAEVAS
ncbi:MAG TPA: hypothetical protein VHZ99_05120 [Steroidobacteraceae bacterium]|nr:hypothetical protein [Steroidobacteraceae bacterium]